jgi:hypothetical protein
MYILITIPIFFIVFLTLVARFEKRMVWPYGQLDTQPQFSDTNGYGGRWVADAVRVGFTFLGWAPDLKGPQYRVCYAFLASPEGDYFVIVGIGTVINLPVRGTWIYSRGKDGSVYYTTDNQSCVAIDVSRQWRTQLVRVNTFPELLQHHKDLLQSCDFTSLPFSAGRETDEFRKLREEHYQFMSRQGLIAFTDYSNTHWRYTFWGAFKFSVLNYSIGLLRRLTYGRVPRSA